MGITEREYHLLISNRYFLKGYFAGDVVLTTVINNLSMKSVQEDLKKAGFMLQTVTSLINHLENSGFPETWRDRTPSFTEFLSFFSTRKRPLSWRNKIRLGVTAAAVAAGLTFGTPKDTKMEHPGATRANATQSFGKDRGGATLNAEKASKEKQETSGNGKEPPEPYIIKSEHYGVLRGAVIESKNKDGQLREIYAKKLLRYREVIDLHDGILKRGQGGEKKKELGGYKAELTELEQTLDSLKKQIEELVDKINTAASLMDNVEAIAWKFMEAKAKNKEIEFNNKKVDRMIDENGYEVTKREGAIRKKFTYSTWHKCTTDFSWKEYAFDVSNSFTRDEEELGKRFQQEISTFNELVLLIDRWLLGVEVFAPSPPPPTDPDVIKKLVMRVLEFLKENVSYYSDYERPGADKTTPYSKPVDKSTYYDLHKTFDQMLIDGGGDCEDYSLAAARLLNGMGIPAGLVIGEEDGGIHAVVGLILPIKFKDAKDAKSKPIFRGEEKTYQGKIVWIAFIEPQSTDASPPGNNFKPEKMIMPDGSIMEWK